MAGKKRDLVKMEPVPAVASPPLLEDLRRMIEETRRGVAATVNVALTLLYWRIGKRINEEILKGGRAEYGAEILATVSQELVRDYGRGFSYSALTRMLKISDVFPDKKIVSTLSRQLMTEYGRRFSEKSLCHMLRFAEAFPDKRIVSARMRQFAEGFPEERIVVSLIRELSWSHFKKFTPERKGVSYGWFSSRLCAFA